MTEVLCFDTSTGIYFKTTLQAIETAVERLNVNTGERHEICASMTEADEPFLKIK